MGTVEVKRDVSLTSDDRGGAWQLARGSRAARPARPRPGAAVAGATDQPTAGDIAAAWTWPPAPAAAVDAAGAAGPSPNGPPQAPPDAGQQSAPGGADAERWVAVEDMMED